jgi:hypothetical protein
VWPPSNDAAAIKRPPAFAAATAVAAVNSGTATTIVKLTIVHCQKERGSITTTSSIPAAAPTQKHLQVPAFEVCNVGQGNLAQVVTIKNTFFAIYILVDDSLHVFGKW